MLLNYDNRWSHAPNALPASVKNMLPEFLIWKINVLGIFDMVNSFKLRSLLYREVLKFLSHKTFGWECMMYVPYILKEVVSLHSQPKVRFRAYFVYFVIRQKSLKNQSFRRCWEHWFYILIIMNNCSTWKPVI